jgi:hypothetical protein
MLPIQSAMYRSQFQRDHRVRMFRSVALALRLRKVTACSLRSDSLPV